MCGLAGAICLADPPAQGLERAVRAMADTLTHRGPDDGGVWVDEAAGVGLGHRRLSIVDLSPAGHQPMGSADGRYVIAYNGEIYNAEDLRAALPGIAWRGHSDTEVLVEACAAWGVEATAKRLIGMFAFALWDRAARRLWLVRDRLGIKPLYWSLVDGRLLFGSELKALEAWPGFDRAIDRAALSAYFRYSYVPAPHSIYEGVAKLPQGHLLEWASGDEPAVRRYWSLSEVARAGAADRHAGTPDEIADDLEALLSDAVGRRMVADVPLGAFLSGGVDSSLIVALMQRQSGRPVKTFTIGMDDAAYDESDHARAVAEHLGTEHTEVRLSGGEALALVPDLPTMYDEPFADSSQIPTHLVSRLAREHVTVALSGDGGDELFLGYDRYFHAAKLWDRFGRLPMRPLLARLAGMAPGDRARKLAEVLGCADEVALLRRIVSLWQRPADLVPGVAPAAGPLDGAGWAEALPDRFDRFQVLDSLTHLTDDILTKVDRASMACSLEVRVPILDHRVAEFAFRVPPHLRHATGVGKDPLRRVLYRHVPRALIERPKKGFMVPVAAWLRGALKDWAESLIEGGPLDAEAALDPRPIRRAWTRHRAGEDRASELWAVLMYLAWRQRT